MVTDSDHVEASASESEPGWREALPWSYRRSGDDQLVTGTAAGIATRLGIPSPYVRAAFLVLALAGGIGIALYLAAWAVSNDPAPEADQVAPAEDRQRMALAVMFLGLLIGLRGLDLWFGDSLVWPGALIAFGTAAVLDRRDVTGAPQDVFLSPSRTRLIAGAVIMLAGLVYLFSSVDALANLGPIVVAVSVTAVGFMLVFGPWVWRLGTDLADERRDRIRTDERSEVAAHLHDSVLQTLALIQRSDDPRRMVTLARAQERELRSWLYGEHGAGHLVRALEELAARVEQAHDVPVEVVAAGDTEINDDLRAIVGAAGEAITNAAKHSGAARISVYAEITDARVDVWVSDQGSGFDVTEPPGNGRGIKESIKHRMDRHGGTADIVSNHDGTEVHLGLDRSRRP